MSDLTAREQEFLNTLERGQWPVRQLMAELEEDGMLLPDVAGLLIYAAVREIFDRADSREQAEQFLRGTFNAALTELLNNRRLS
jgi:hypothetical protein